MGTSNPDLDCALAFVIKRVEEEATRLRVSLDHGERYLLTHLPATSEFSGWVDPELPRLVPRDIAFEKLCALAKAARVRDLQTRPEMAHEWEFVAAVLKLNRHPMSWLLQWAGLKDRRPWWDGWLLLGMALLVTVIGMAVMLFAETRGSSWNWSHWTAFSCVCVVIVACVYLALRRLEGRQARQAVEKSRRDLAT